MDNMTNYKKVLPIACVAMVALSGYAETKLDVVDILGRKYYVYEAKKDDTLFGIARKYGWDDVELARVNSKVTSPLEKGTKIYYPCEMTVGTVANQSDDLNLSAQPLSHKVKKGETVYAISRLYNIPVETIYRLNPGSREGIKAGETLKLRDIERAISTDDNPAYYTIKRGDTLYKLAKNFDTTVAAILELNPGISEFNFKADEVIRVPKKGEGIKKTTQMVEEETVEGFEPYKVSKHDTWDSIAQRNGISEEALRDANKNVRKLKNKEIIGIPVVSTDSVERTIIEEDPREQTISGIKHIYNDVHGIMTDSIKKEVRIAILLSEPNSKKDLDFTRGFLTGVNDDVKAANYPVNVSVFDGTKKSTVIIENLDNFKPDLVFSTSDHGTPDYLADYALVSQTPVVNTFDLKDDFYTRNPYIIQLLSPSNYFNDEIINNLKKDYKDYNLMFMGDTDDSDQLAGALEEIWDISRIKKISDPEILGSLNLNSADKYLIYGTANKKSEIAESLKAVKKLREGNPYAEIVFVGRPNWMAYDETLATELHEADTYIPSRFYFDKDSQEGKIFNLKYKALFNMTPVKSYPMYAAMGYDTAEYFIPTLIWANGDLNKFIPSEETVQSDFDLYRPTNWSGFINPVVYLVRFEPGNNSYKIKIK